jgi:hypothetical protein
VILLTLSFYRYCVGTRRQTLLNQKHIDLCYLFLECGDVNNYEMRMVAEVKLYWTMHHKCSGLQVDLRDAKLALQSWQKEWAHLFSKHTKSHLQVKYSFIDMTM